MGILSNSNLEQDRIRAGSPHIGPGLPCTWLKSVVLARIGRFSHIRGNNSVTATRNPNSHCLVYTICPNRVVILGHC